MIEDTVELEKMRLAIEQQLSKEFLIDSVEWSENFLLDSLSFILRGYVWGEAEAVKMIDVKYPSDWWQAFKKRFFPYWLERRFPVQYETVTIEAKAIYPEFKPKLPDEKSVLVLRR